MASPADASNLRFRLHYVNVQDDNETPGPPNDAEEVHSLIENGGYRPGDIINFDRYRFSFAYIVMLNQATGRYYLVQNPDDSGSGYLTLPEEVLEVNSDVVGKYADVMANAGSVIFHLPASDKFVKDKLREGIPEGWKFVAEFIEGDLERFSVRPPGSDDFRDIDYSTLTWPRLQATFEYENEPKAAMRVSVRLEGDRLRQYKAEKGNPNDNYAWLRARPSVPVSWTLESGGGGAGSNHHHSSWILKGPQRYEQEVRQAVENFLEGYDFEISRIELP